MTITPDTIITAELLAGLDKCPFCGAEKQQKNNQWRQFGCWTVIYINQLAVVSRSTRCVGYELTTLRARVKELEEELECNGRVLHSMQTERDNALALLGVYKMRNDELKGTK